MQVGKDKILKVGLLILVIVLLLAVVFFVTKKKNSFDGDYYYKFVYDDNKVTQSVWVYDSKDELQTKYYLLYEDEPISYTKGEKAVVTMNLVDLKDHQTLTLVFEENPDKEYEVVFRK